jgi:tetratricopeptide (TPR) repeat protein
MDKTSADFDRQLPTAAALLQRGDPGAARTICRRYLQTHPADGQGWHLLGLIEHALGARDAALAALAQGEALGARSPSQRANYAGVLNALGEPVQAFDMAEAALAERPDLPPALINAGLAAAALGRHESALPRLEAGLVQRPLALPALAGHESVLTDAESALNLIRAFPFGVFGEPRAALLAALAERHPAAISVRYELAAALHVAGLGADALPHARRVHEQLPDHADAALVLSASLLEHGRASESLAVLRDLLAREPGNDTAWANYLVGLHYDPSLDQAALAMEHARWATVRLTGIDAAPALELLREPVAERSLRIGWLSPRFARGAVMQFFDGLLPAFDRDYATHIVYHDRVDEDEAAQRLRTQAQEWRQVGGQDDDTLLARMRADRLDILVDLAGHAPHNRLRMLARRAAPIQATWMDYVDTTAVPAMDLLLMDAAMAPDGSETWASERIVRLEPCRLSFQPPEDGPDCDWSGAADAPFTLGCCNRMPKRHAGVFDRYAKILAALPQSRLILLDAAFEGTLLREHAASWLRERGVDLARVEFRGRQPYRALLETYREIDAVVDPFPYSGCTTTCDALWMGVPVLSTPGSTCASRQSAMFLRAIGREDWLYPDETALIDGFRALAADPARRQRRAEWRERMRASVCDRRALAGSLQMTFRQAWHDLIASS